MFTRRNLMKSTAALSLLAAFPANALAKAALIGTQAPGFYRVKLGDYEVTALSDGTAPMDMSKIYQGISEADAAAYLLGAFQTEKTELSVNAFMVNTGERLVLIDTGTGNLMGAALGKLTSNIEASGYQVDQIDDVIVTHIHADHTGGLTTPDGARVFKNAMLHVNETEAGFWLEGKADSKSISAPAEQVAQAHANFDPYIAAGKLHKFADNADPIPGFKSIFSPGHTPGHSSIVVESGAQKIVFWGDIAHGDLLQFDRPEVTVSFDHDQPYAAQTRLTAFEEAANEKYLVAAAHHAFPGIGHVRRDEQNYDWVPLAYRATY